MHYALTRLWILPPPPARLGARRLSRPHLRGLGSARPLLSPRSHSWGRGNFDRTHGQPSGVLSLSLSFLTDTHTEDKHTHLDFFALGLEMGRWAEKVCHQQKRTE